MVARDLVGDVDIGVLDQRQERTSTVGKDAVHVHVLPSVSDHLPGP
jgi:hypothetical protein